MTRDAGHVTRDADTDAAPQFLAASPYREQFRAVVSPPQPLDNFEAALELALAGKYHRVLLKM